MIKIKNFFVVFAVFFFAFPARALVLDWSGSYQVEVLLAEKGSFDEWNFETWHNLHLKPSIIASDKIQIKSWFQLAASKSFYENAPESLFYSQITQPFGLYVDGKKNLHPPTLALKDLYAKVSHDFNWFEIGWRPYQFGLGMYYNDGSKIFSPVYSKTKGAKGFVSWRAFIGSSIYVQPMLQYIEDLLFHPFIQAGFTKDKYGVEGIYKASPFGLKHSSGPQDSSDYLGVHAYYNASQFHAKLEVGSLLSEKKLYGIIMEMDWATPWKRLDLALQASLSTSNEKTSFYFDPNFNPSLFIAEYEDFQSPAKPYLKQYLFYSFHSAVNLTPSLSFSLLESLDMTVSISTYLSYPELEFSLGEADLVLNYYLPEGFTWTNGLGFLFSQEEDFYIGFVSQAAITF